MAHLIFLLLSTKFNVLLLSAWCCSVIRLIRYHYQPNTALYHANTDLY